MESFRRIINRASGALFLTFPLRLATAFMTVFLRIIILCSRYVDDAIRSSVNLGRRALMAKFDVIAISLSTLMTVSSWG